MIDEKTSLLHNKNKLLTRKFTGNLLSSDKNYHVKYINMSPHDFEIEGIWYNYNQFSWHAAQLLLMLLPFIFKFIIE